MRLFEKVLTDKADRGRLPVASQKKIESMAEKCELLRARARSLSDQVREAISLKGQINNELRGLREAISRALVGRRVQDEQGVKWEENDQFFNRANDALGEQQKIIDDLQARQALVKAELELAGGCLQVLSGWLEDNRKSSFRPAKVVPARGLKPGEDWKAAIERQRGLIAQIKAEIHRTRSAPIPSDDVKEKLRQDLAALVEEGTPDVSPVFEGGQIRWPRTRLLTADGSLITGNMPNIHGLLAWLNKDYLLARLDAEVDALADDEKALSHNDRLAKDRDLRKQLLQHEREEEAMIMAAGENNVLIYRRAYADPRAVLELVDDLPGIDWSEFE